MRAIRFHFLRLIALVTAGTVFAAGCTPPAARHAEDIPFRSVALDLDGLRINQQAAASHISIDAAFADSKLLNRTFGSKSRAMFGDADVYFVGVVRVDEQQGRYLRSISVEFVEPDVLRGKRVEFREPDFLVRGDERFFLYRIVGPTTSIPRNGKVAVPDVYQQVRTQAIRLRVTDVFVK